MEKAEIKAVFRELENYREIMSKHQADFIRGLKKYFSRNNKLSHRQEDALRNILAGLSVKPEEKVHTR